MLNVCAVAEIQCEGLEPARTHAELSHYMISDEKNRSAVDTSGEFDANRFVRRNFFEPLGDFIGQRTDVAAANFVEIRGKGVASRRKIAGVSRVGIGTADELQLNNIVRGHHSRVAWMKLSVKSLGLELIENTVNAISHDQRRPSGSLRKEVAHWPVK